MISFVIFVACFAAIFASPQDYYQSGQSVEAPMPYDFSYSAVDEYGNQHGRSETGDQNGNVKGRYQYINVDGINRNVEYIADDNGFRAFIKTNEPGTDNKNPADVQIQADPLQVTPRKVAQY